MTITVPSEFKSFVEQAVASGRYRSEAEVFADALRLLREHQRKWVALRDDIQIGLEELEHGENSPLDIEDIKRRGRQTLAEKSSRS